MFRNDFRLPVGKPREYEFDMQQWLFLDGSGRPKTHRFVSYGGYLVSSEHANTFFDRWNDVLSDEMVPYLSMKEIMRWDGIWEHKRRQWGDDADAKRAAFLLRMADTIMACRVFGFGHASVDTQIRPLIDT